MQKCNKGHLENKLVQTNQLKSIRYVLNIVLSLKYSVTQFMAACALVPNKYRYIIVVSETIGFLSLVIMVRIP